MRRQDLLCLFLYYLGFSRIRNLSFRWRRIPIARILAFHDVPSSQVLAFRKQLEIAKEVANIVSLSDICAGRMSWKKINVAITFDDGYRGWLDNVCPVLKDLGISATFFVSSGLLCLNEQEERDFLRNNLRSNRYTSGILTAEELRKIAAYGFSIGGHTCNHINMAELDDANELHREIQKDKEELERLTETKVDYFAYPFGSHRNININLMQILQESGYQGAVTLNPGLITDETNKYYLNRDLVNASMLIPVFKARLYGNYDGVTFVRELLRLQGAAFDMP
jgi:peptidoglycan/xylan/chitin deacetylase (PgdA/CDA1 family)